MHNCLWGVLHRKLHLKAVSSSTLLQLYIYTHPHHNNILLTINSTYNLNFLSCSILSLLNFFIHIQFLFERHSLFHQFLSTEKNGVYIEKPRPPDSIQNRNQRWTWRKFGFLRRVEGLRLWSLSPHQQS